MLSGCSECFWRHLYEPPAASIGNIELRFFTAEGAEIPLERTLGFISQEKGEQIYESLVLSSLSKYLAVEYPLHPLELPALTCQ